MSGRQITPQSQVEAYLQQQLQRRELALLKAFIYVGESCIREARENGSYIDRTGNLRSSIGYVILRDGVITNQSSFQQVTGKDGDGKEGTDKGKAFLKKVISESRKGLVLIVVAGMEYSAYVEANNYNVLTSSEIMAEQMVPMILRKLGFKTV